MLSRREFIYGTVSIGVPGAMPQSEAAQPAPVTFAAVADVQYADRDTVGKRDYRSSRRKLAEGATVLAGEKLAFTIQLGDLIDGDVQDYPAIASVFARIAGTKYNVVGNHDFFGTRQAVIKRFGLRRAYYTFRFERWRFVVLDGMDVSVKGGWPADSPNLLGGQKLLAGLKAQRARNANDWNGAVGEEQREWLSGVLARAGRNNERVVVFCHFPTLPEACRPDHLLWDHKDVLAILDAHPPVAYISGHDHNGGYAEHNGVHHLTLAGIVENELSRCLRVIDAHPDRLVVRNPGEKQGRVLLWGPGQSSRSPIG